MMKKNEIIETLENGGYIYMENGQRIAYVYTVYDEKIGTARFDTAERLAALDKYEVIRDAGYSRWYRVCDPYAVAAEKAAAAHELASIRTPGGIELRAKSDAWIGGNRITKGRHYNITVYGDGCQSTPGNAYGKLYDFDTREHAVYFDIVSRPEAAQDADAQSARVEAATREALARAGMLAQEEAPVEEIAPDVVNVDDLRADLDTGDYGEYLNDYRDSSSYISDAVAEIADNNTSIYYSDIMAFISQNPDALADVVAEGLYDPSHGYDVYKHGQAAEYMTIERDIWDHIEDALMLAALDFLKYDLGRDHIPEELADYLEGWVSDPGDRMNEIPDRIRDYFEDTDDKEEE